MNGADFNNISRNEIFGLWYGIGLLWTNDNTLYGNDIHENNCGIRNYGHRNKIISNVVTDNRGAGIRNHNGNNNLKFSFRKDSL